ncbi:hypothetical protein FGO68_gene14869 [Halteria grandinella]|uniref:Uncharacterized protein n=1 Tax=Halteria grandinella TaxID=5974 RepID=A0A8J8NFZ5_HALGN|nr:hypothetical protein FGO68_gene14869 [Halteria grandinella]
MKNVIRMQQRLVEGHQGGEDSDAEDNTNRREERRKRREDDFQQFDDEQPEGGGEGVPQSDPTQIKSTQDFKRINYKDAAGNVEGQVEDVNK